MAKKRLTVCLVAPFLVIVTVVAIFFTVTDPTSWPEQNIELSSTDTRLVPPISTIWCESTALKSVEDFIAYKVQRKPKVNNGALIKQTINLKVKINSRRRHVGMHELKYFLLPGSIISILPCATVDKARVQIWKHQFSKNCFPTEENSDSSDGDDSDDSSDEFRQILEKLKDKQESCAEPSLSRDIPVAQADDHALECKSTGVVTFNVTSEDTYVIMVSNENRKSSNIVRLQIWLDRTTYDYQEMQKSTSICGGPSTSSSTCNVPLTFASEERILLWVPPMGLSSLRQKHININVRCRPRIALFALLTVLFPVVLFVVVSFMLKNDRRRSREQSESLDDGIDVPSDGRRESFVSPLLPDASNSRRSTCGLVSQQTCTDDTQPPSYEVLFDLPPAYSSLDISTNDKS